MDKILTPRAGMLTVADEDEPPPPDYLPGYLLVYLFVYLLIIVFASMKGKAPPVTWGMMPFHFSIARS
jgi:hypothetical protein